MQRKENDYADEEDEKNEADPPVVDFERKSSRWLSPGTRKKFVKKKSLYRYPCQNVHLPKASEEEAEMEKRVNKNMNIRTCHPNRRLTLNVIHIYHGGRVP